MTVLQLTPLTRVEGHGRVDLILEAGKLTDVRLALEESPRLFEALLVGRHCSEVPALVCRICAICSAVHRVAAAMALESAMGIVIPPLARGIRELLLLGGHIESHALHLFCLILPDLTGHASLLDLARAGHPLAAAGLELKAFGNRIQALAGGRPIHPVNVEVGGVLCTPDPDALSALAAESRARQAGLETLLGIFCRVENYPGHAMAIGTRLAVASPDPLPLWGEELVLSDGRRVAAAACRELLAERVVTYSHAKQSGSREQPLLTGALAREERAGEGKMAGFGIHGNNVAQVHELGRALARVAALAEELAGALPGEVTLADWQATAGIGTALCEAPRGLLLHHYVVDDFGRIARADIVTPTAINQAALEAQLLADLQGVSDESELLERAGRIVRAYDPCISCAVHVLKVV